MFILIVLRLNAITKFMYNKNFFDQITILFVWNKGLIIPGINPSFKRKDACGAIIEFSKHGDTVENGFGWEIDHIVPKSLGGNDNLSNLRPLQWQNNREKGESLTMHCPVRSR